MLILTNKVQLSELVTRDMSANLRGLNINTARNGAFKDLVEVGDMPSLDDGETLEIRTGHGDDALNIDGRLGPFTSTDVLDAQLGEEGVNL